MRTIFKLILLLCSAGYLIFATYRFLTHEDTAQCKRVDIEIADSAQATLITERDVEMMLRKSNLYPLGRSMKDVNLLMLERGLLKDPFISKVVCVKTPGENVRIRVEQRLPLLRVMNDAGDDYYVDNKGFRMAARGYEADLAIVTGKANERYVREHLLELGRILRDDGFWNNQIEQIAVRPGGDLDLVMRVGIPVVHFGRPDSLRLKLRNLHAFYDKVLPNVGWHRYKEISVAYENQVIGKK